MADTVDTVVLHSSGSYYHARFVSKSDGTGESDVVKIDKSTLTGTDGREPIALDLVEITWSVFGASHVLLEWDHSTDDEMLILSGNGYLKYGESGPLKDPRSAGGTGDVLLTTSGMAANGGYVIDALFELRHATSS